MEFKKQKISTKHFSGFKKQSNFLSNLVGILSIIIILFMGAILINNIHFKSFDFVKKIVLETGNTFNNVKNTLNITDDNIAKSEVDKEKINILVVGRGGGTHDAPDLTDSIILASLNIKKETITLLSIPRDIYVGGGKGANGKINAIYARSGMDELKEKITQITNEKIDYFLNIDFKGFIKIVDTIGGVEIDVPNNFVDKEYPDENGGYRTLVFQKGKWIFDGENALKYSRSRHSTSDFDRSLRQQQIIKSLKDKLLSSYFIMSPGKMMNFYDVVVKYVYTDLTTSEILRITYLLTTGDYKMLSFNFNDNCYYGSSDCEKGGFLYSPSRDDFGGMSVLLLEGTDISNLSKYDVINKFSNLIFNDGEVFKENYKINIFNSLKVTNLALELGNNMKKYGFNIPNEQSVGNTKELYEKSIIYYNNIEENSVTLKVLKDFFTGEFKKVEKPMYSQDIETKIEIIIGNDYVKDMYKKQIFSF